MATFASSSLSKRAAGEAIADDEDDGPAATPAYEPKRILTSEVGSLFELKSEILKKRASIVKSSGSIEYRAGKKGVLALKKEDKAVTKGDAALRRDRIRELDREIRREEDEKLATASRKLQEKANLYDKLARGDVDLSNGDGTPLEFMVDFGSKKRSDDSRSYMDSEPTSSKKAAPVHFAPDEERRVYGVSHMTFSTEEETRRVEIEALKKMTKDTDATRNKHQEVVEKREKDRREKINRMRKRMGLPEIKEPTPPPAIDLEEIPMPAAPEETLKEQVEKRLKSDREWDQGKDRFHRWVEKERDERDDDFRPPDSYFR